MWNNANMQEEFQWGNIELPGLSDEKLLNTNWTKVDVIKEIRSRDSWQKKINESYKSLERNKKISEKSKANFQNSEYVEKHRQIRIELWKDQQFQSKMETAYENRSKGDWKTNTVKANNKRARNIITPDGEFESIGLAAKFYKISPVAVSTRMQRHPDIYYFKDEGPKEPTVIDYKKLHAEGIERRKNNPKWQEYCQRLREKPKVKFQCPDGIFTCEEALKFYKISKPTLYNRLKSDSKNWKKLGK